jgi:hypothetical protein
LRWRSARKVCGTRPAVSSGARGSPGWSPICARDAPILNFQDNARYNGGSMKAAFSQENSLADDKLYQAEYVGSGTFIITKPKRKKTKARQTNVKNPRRGSRK